MRKAYLELGKILGTHGVRRELKLEPWTDSPAVYAKIRTVYLGKHGTGPLALEHARPHKTHELITLEGVTDRDQAESYRGKILYVAREDILPEDGGYLVAEIIGCTVKDADDPSRIYGKVVDVTNAGASDIWHVKADGKTVLMPLIPGLLDSVDLDREVALVRPIKGIFDDGITVKGE